MAVLPIYNTLAVPDTSIYFKDDYYRKMTNRTPLSGDKVTMIVAKESMEKDQMTAESFYPIGITGVITEINPNGYIVIHTRNRVNIEEVIVYKDHSIDLTVSKRPDIDDLDHEDAQKRLKAIKTAAVKWSEDYQWGTAVRSYIAGWNTIGDAAATISPWMMNSNAEKYEILATDSLSERTDMLEKIIFENLEMIRINDEAKNAQEEGYQKIYRESAIKKQMEYLQKELDEMHPENVSDIRRFEIKIAESDMNDEARKEAEKVLNRLKQEGESGAESGMLYDYLDYVTELPWSKEAPERISLTEAKEILDEDHFGLEKVKKRIVQQIAVLSLKNAQSGSIICFVGAPGTGKTSIGQSIARALHRKYVRVSLGGVRDEADIRGHRRTYIGAMPGRIMDGIAKAGVSNPVMVLDEIDKLSQSYNGDPASALLEVLDPEQNATFTDHYMNVPYDLSDVLFICTANSLDTIPQPLLDRMEVIEFQGYTPSEKFQIAKRHLIPKSEETVGIEDEAMTITDEALHTIISDYTREGGVRGLKKRIDSICRSAAVDIVAQHETAKLTNHTDSFTPLRITPENLRDYLDMNPIHRKGVSDSGKPGIITGLAWTQVGGEILYIETMFTKGSGKLIITGQLGDVMKESAQIAVSLVKSMFPEKSSLFEENDLHIHVPDGATPKDGPSAGITLVTALSSLVTDTPVTSHIAMTGEVSLRGEVNPIGGLPEKLMAAQRAGVTTVFIPKDNEDDLRDVAQEVKSQLTIIPVSEAVDVLKYCDIISDTTAQAV